MRKTFVVSIMLVLFLAVLNAEMVIHFSNGSVFPIDVGIVDKITFSTKIPASEPRTVQILDNNQRLAVRTYTFKSQSDLNKWSTDWVWESNYKSSGYKGTVTLSNEFGGSAKFTVSGAPSIIDFSTRLQDRLQYGDTIYIIYHTKDSMRPASNFELILGPSRKGFIQKVPVGQSSSGTHRAELSFFWEDQLSGNEPFGIHFSVWPGTQSIWISEIGILR